MKIGYVGLGIMGGALATRLQLTHDLLVYDLNETSVQRLVEAGASPCADLLELGAQSDVVLLCLPTSDHVRTVIFGHGGLATAVRPGTLLVDQTSGDPRATRAMAAELEPMGIELIDAPVSGGPRGAEAGTIAIMIGATREQLERILPLMNAISPNVFHAGELGSGHTIKLVNNLISMSQRLLTFEGVSLAVKNGMDPLRALEILRAGGAKNAYMEEMARIVEDWSLSSDFTLALVHKDVRLACELGVASEVPMFYGNLTRELYGMYISELGRGAKIDAPAGVIGRLAGVRLVQDGSADPAVSNEIAG